MILIISHWSLYHQDTEKWCINVLDWRKWKRRRDRGREGGGGERKIKRKYENSQKRKRLRSANYKIISFQICIYFLSYFWEFIDSGSKSLKVERRSEDFQLRFILFISEKKEVKLIIYPRKLKENNFRDYRLLIKNLHIYDECQMKGNRLGKKFFTG